MPRPSERTPRCSTEGCHDPAFARYGQLAELLCLRHLRPRPAAPFTYVTANDKARA